MTNRITFQRFRALAEIYGANLDRWPASDRAAAEAWARDREGEEVLRQAHALDAALDRWPDHRLPADLVQRTLASLAEGSARRPVKQWPGKQASLEHPPVKPTSAKDAGASARRLWWMGVGLAAAFSGLAAGSVAASTFLPDNPDDAASTSFGDIPDTEE